jgi:hypothetical protein
MTVFDLDGAKAVHLGCPTTTLRWLQPHTSRGPGAFATRCYPPGATSPRAARGLAAPCSGRRLTESPARCKFVELALGTWGGLRSPLFRWRANQSPSLGSYSGWGFGASQGSVLAEGTEHKHQHPFLAGSSSARGFTAADFLVRSDAGHLPRWGRSVVSTRCPPGRVCRRAGTPRRHP